MCLECPGLLRSPAAPERRLSADRDIEISGGEVAFRGRVGATTVAGYSIDSTVSAANTMRGKLCSRWS